MIKECIPYSYSEKLRNIVTCKIKESRIKLSFVRNDTTLSIFARLNLYLHASAMRFTMPGPS